MTQEHLFSMQLEVSKSPEEFEKEVEIHMEEIWLDQTEYHNKQKEGEDLNG